MERTECLCPCSPVGLVVDAVDGQVGDAHLLVVGALAARRAPAAGPGEDGPLDGVADERARGRGGVAVPQRGRGGRVVAREEGEVVEGEVVDAEDDEGAARVEPGDEGDGAYGASEGVVVEAEEGRGGREGEEGDAGRGEGGGEGAGEGAQDGGCREQHGASVVVVVDLVEREGEGEGEGEGSTRSEQSRAVSGERRCGWVWLSRSTE